MSMPITEHVYMGTPGKGRGGLYVGMLGKYNLPELLASAWFETQTKQDLSLFISDGLA